MNYRKVDNKLIIKLKQGEEIIDSIKAACSQNNISAGIFQGLGAISSAKLSAYQLETKQYISQDFKEPLEISALIGNIAQLDNEIIIHAHTTLGKADFSTISGHLDHAIVSATCEIILSELNLNLKRKFDEHIGLNLLDI